MASWHDEWDAPQPKEWGVSPPRSLDTPTANDLARTNALKRFLEKIGISESKNDDKLKKVLDELLKIVKSWVKRIAEEKSLEIEGEPNAKLFSFGSYLLEYISVYIPEDDLDILCVGPSYVDREHDFFTILSVTLRSMEEVTGLQCFPGAHIPAIKFKFHGISVDLTYASVPLLIVPDGLDICDDKLITIPSISKPLSGEDETTLRCLNTCRVASSILKLVPNREVFQTTLRFLKHWAKARGIYCNDTGCLGGTPWALLVARICQAHPFAQSSTLVSMFFNIYDEWVWPTPVMLCHIVGENQIGFVWNPKTAVDKAHIMPVISPSYPCRNLSSNVSWFTQRVVIEQFKISNKICKRIRMDDDWHELCQPFLEAYKLYLCIKISADNIQDLEAWKGWIKPFWQQLPSKIELPMAVLRCHLNPHDYVDTSGGTSVYQIIGLSRIELLQGLGLEVSTPKVSPSEIQQLKDNIQKYDLIKSGMKFRVSHYTKTAIDRLHLK